MGNIRTIGKAAKAAGISVETVRYYERQGLIDQPARTAGPRHYDDRTMAMLKYVRVAQGFGLTLREIKLLRSELGHGRAFCASLRQLVERKLAELARKQQELRILEQELSTFLDRCASRAPHLACPVVEELTTLHRFVGTDTPHQRASA